MKIILDISQVVYQGTGVARYTRNLVKALQEIDKKNEYLLFFSSLRRDLAEAGLTINQQNFQVRQFKLPPTGLDFLWNQWHILPIERLCGVADIYHSSDWAQAPSRAKKVTTLHDMIVYKYPETFVGANRPIVETQKRRMERVKKESDIIICDSEATKNDAQEILGIEEERLKVIYPGVEDRFFTDNADDARITRMKKKYGIEVEYVLSIGTREPRKNLERAISAFNLLKEKDLNYVIGGNFGWESQKSQIPISKSKTNPKSQYPNPKYPLNEKIKFIGFVEDEDLPYLYAGAKVFVYPSLYEGFGLPVLEAMAAGCPVVTSNVSSLPEVGGEVAIYVNPLSVENIACGIEKALKVDRQVVGKNLIAQARKFSWHSCAKEIIKIYGSLVK